MQSVELLNRGGRVPLKEKVGKNKLETESKVTNDVFLVLKHIMESLQNKLMFGEWKEK